MTLESAISEIAHNNPQKKHWDTPLDYFSWGRDKRHKMDNTERLPKDLHSVRKFLLGKVWRVTSMLRSFMPHKSEGIILAEFRRRYKSFEESYQLMSSEHSKNLFAELVFMKLVTEKRMRLSSFSKSFIDSYEQASAMILASCETLQVYKWVLRKIDLNAPKLAFFTTPVLLNLHLLGRLYRYQDDKSCVEVEGGDIVIDAGVGWGDTTVYLASLANQKPGGHLYAFDILEEGLAALKEQQKLNPHINNLTPMLLGLSDKDGDHVNISSPSPSARIVKSKTSRTVETITIDTFCNQQALEKVDFIKMDIEGGEVPALVGASETIKKFKPKLAISVYHKWDDFLTIPNLIHSLRDDYDFYLDCTTGFGGETVLYCR